MAAEGGEVVYFGGFNRSGISVWYRLDVNSLEKTKVDGEAYVGKRKKIKISSTRGRPLFRWVFVKNPNKKKKIHRVSLSPAAVLLYSFTGSSTLVGRDLYYFGKGPLPSSDTTGRTCYSMFLAKHATDHPDPRSWDVLYSRLGVSPYQFVVFPVGRKLYVLGGVDSNYNLLGGIYNLDLGRWDKFRGDMYKTNGGCYDGYYLAPYIALAEDKTHFLFYSLKKGSVLSFDITSLKVLSEDKYHSSLALRLRTNVGSLPHDGSLPQGLDSCDLSVLTPAARRGPGCLSQDTLYWFTSGLVLYGYHLEKKRWFRSSFLGDQFPTVTVNRSTIPSLVALSGGKLFAIIYEGQGEVTVAPLMVVREEDSLCVTVQSFHALSHGDKSLFPLATMSTSVKG